MPLRIQVALPVSAVYLHQAELSVGVVVFMAKQPSNLDLYIMVCT